MTKANSWLLEECLAQNTTRLARAQQAIEAAQATKARATRQLWLVAAMLVLLSVCLVAELYQAFKAHGPSQAEKARLEQLIEAQ